MSHLETPFTHTPKLSGTPFQQNKPVIMFGGLVATMVALTLLMLGLAHQEHSSLLASFSLVTLFASLISGAMFVRFLELHGENKKNSLLHDSLSWGAWKRDKWVYNFLVPYIEKEYNLFLGACKDFRTLEFDARTESNETITLTVKGIEENGYTYGDPALNGYVISGEFGIKIIKGSLEHSKTSETALSL